MRDVITHATPWAYGISPAASSALLSAEPISGLLMPNTDQNPRPKVLTGVPPNDSPNFPPFHAFIAARKMGRTETTSFICSVALDMSVHFSAAPNDSAARSLALM